MHKWITYKLTGQSNVTIQEHLHMKVTNKFSKVLGHFELIKL